MDENKHRSGGEGGTWVPIVRVLSSYKFVFLCALCSTQVLVHSLIDPSYLNQSFDVLNEAPRRCLASPADHEHIENVKSSTTTTPFLNGGSGEEGETTAMLWTLMNRLKNVKYDYARSGADQLLAAHEQTEESRIMFDNLLRGQQQRHASRMDSTRLGRRS